MEQLTYKVPHAIFKERKTQNKTTNESKYSIFSM